MENAPNLRFQPTGFASLRSARLRLKREPLGGNLRATISQTGYDGMSNQIRQQLDGLFSLKNSGAMRVFLFAKFYEDLLREYFRHSGYQVLSGKPRIFWKKVPVPSVITSEKHKRLVNRLRELQKSAVHCTPDGLFVKDGKYFVWEAKNWVQELYPSPFADRIWDFAWLLAKQVEYKGQVYDLSGFLISWWERENGMDEALAELRKCVHPLTVDLVVTKEVLEECIAAEYDWYLALVRDRQQNVNEFFDVLLGTHHRRK
ncbi:MAG: hypothetical protein QXU75_06060 [Candidatus Methanomethylicaceae archaeon]